MKILEICKNYQASKYAWMLSLRTEHNGLQTLPPVLQRKIKLNQKMEWAGITGLVIGTKNTKIAIL